MMSEKSVPKFGVGDKVKIVCAGYGFGPIDLGKTVTIKEIGTYSGGYTPEVGYIIEEKLGNTKSGYYGGFCGERSFELVQKAAFTKNDLKTGMRVILRNGDRYIVMKEEGILVNYSEFAFLSNFNNKLESNRSEFDIVEVRAKPTTKQHLVNMSYQGEILYIRPKKTDREKKMEELEASIKEAQKQLNELREMK